MVKYWILVLFLTVCLQEVYSATNRPIYHDPGLFWFPRLKIKLGKPESAESPSGHGKESELSIRRYRLVTMALALSHHLRDTTDKVYYNPMHPAFYNSTYRNCLRYINMMVSWSDALLRDPKKTAASDTKLRITNEEKALIPPALRTLFPYITSKQWAEEDTFNKIWGKRPLL